MSQWAWVYGLFGFAFVSFSWMIGDEIYSVFEAWGLANPGGYDTDVFNFFIALWTIIGVVFFFSFLVWNFVQTQRRQSDYV